MKKIYTKNLGRDTWNIISLGMCGRQGLRPDVHHFILILVTLTWLILIVNLTGPTISLETIFGALL